MGLKRTSEKSREGGKGKRKVNPTIVIICEGKDTEVAYFQNFNSKYTKVDVRIAEKNSKGKNKGKATDPESLVRKAVEIKEGYSIIEKDGDRVWCMFDVDINRNNNNAEDSKIAEINKAAVIADKNKIRLGVSSPCFEIWYLLHFEYTTAHMKDYGAVNKRLIKYIPYYEKNQDVYQLLKESLHLALINAEKLRNYHIESGRNLPLNESENLKVDAFSIVNSNPYTCVDNLINYMEKLEKIKLGL